MLSISPVTAIFAGTSGSSQSTVIRAMTALNETFTRPAAFNADAYWHGAWGIVRGTLVTVRVVFSPAVAPTFGDACGTRAKNRELAAAAGNCA